jgi:cytochrome P450
MPLVGAKGNILRFFADPVGAMLRLKREHGNLAALSDRNPAMLCVFGPELTQQVLSDANLFHNNEEPLIPLPKGSAAERLFVSLPMMNGPRHQRLRRLMMPALHRNVLNKHREYIAALTERRMQRWVPGQTLDLAAEMHELTLEIALKCFFDLEDVSTDDNIGRLSERYITSVLSLSSFLLPYDLPGTSYRKLLRTAETLQASIVRLIARKRAQPELLNDALSLLIQAQDEDGAPMTEDELIAQANGLLIAGHVTSSLTITWTFFLLSQHPQVLTDLVDEITGTLRGAAPTTQQLTELPLLDGVIKESMRLLPALPMSFMRFSQHRFQLGDVELPRGTGLIVSPLITQRDPDIFQEPNRFNPSRWNILKPGPYEYFPFGAGPRRCIGFSFFDLSSRIVLSTILQRYHLALVPNARVSRKAQGPAMSVKHGLSMIPRPLTRGIAPPAPVLGDIHELVQLAQRSTGT